MVGLGKEHFRYTNNNYDPNYDAETNENHPEWCKNCAHFGEADYYNACADTPTIDLLPYGPGPHTVSYCGHCDRFRYGKRLGGEVAKPSLIKHLALKAHGFVYQDQKTR